MRLPTRLRDALFLALLMAGSAPACRSVEHSFQFEPVATDRLAWWREARFGMFVHWGLYAIPAGQWNGRTDYGEWIRAKAQIGIDEYENLATRFAPQAFDADRWAAIAADAGMGYMVVTTKHHDGFSLFDSKETEFDVMSTPLGRDVMAEVARACRARGIVPCWYYSIMDWHHPDYLPRRGFEVDRPSAGADYERYERYLSAQVTELLSNYGPIGVMWFDGEWESTWTASRGQRLYDLCRTLQPNVLVNNRVGAGRAGMNGFVNDAAGSGDFGTPEQQVPSQRPVGVDWESCLTINDNWGFNASDKNFKSTRDLLRTLVDIVSKGGNLLLNVGPDAHGEIPAECVERLASIGRWMRVNGTAIHGTTACPIDAPAFGRLTCSTAGGSTRLFAHVFDWPADGRFVIDGLGNPIISARLLADRSRAIEIDTQRGRTVLKIQGGASDPDVSVIELAFQGEPIPYKAPLIETESDLFIDEAIVTVAVPSTALEARYTLDGSEPTLASALARGPITVQDSTVVRARSFHEGVPVGSIVTRPLVRTKPSQALHETALAPGLVFTSSTATGDDPGLPRRPDAETRIVESLAIPLTVRERDDLHCTFGGLVLVDTEDVYGFKLESDAGSRVTIDGVIVCEKLAKSAVGKATGSVALAAGWHSIEVRVEGLPRGAGFTLRMGRAGGERRPIPSARLAHRK